MKLGSSQDCARRQYEYSSFVCVCNSTYCDTAPSVGSLARGRAVLVSSTKDSSRFETSNLLFNENSNLRIYAYNNKCNIKFLNNLFYRINII